MMRARHLHEDRLFDCYLADRAGEAIDPPAAEHLSDCSQCAARYGDLVRLMDELRAEADLETHEIFSAEHLQAERQQIARRIEHVGHAARVISFPAHPAGPRHTLRPSRTVVRWISAAAVAGLFVGVYVGGFVNPIRRGPWLEHSQLARVRTQAVHLGQPAVLRSAPQPVSGEVASAPAVDDGSDEFLQELELAGDRPHTPELVALDDLTPHVRSVETDLH